MKAENALTGSSFGVVRRITIHFQYAFRILPAEDLCQVGAA
jgi:hypothetical protein